MRGLAQLSGVGLAACATVAKRRARPFQAEFARFWAFLLTFSLLRRLTSITYESSDGHLPARACPEDLEFARLLL